jgi:hypothetical protein
LFNATFSNISAISWRPVLVVEEAGVPRENYRQWAVFLNIDINIKMQIRTRCL